MQCLIVRGFFILFYIFLSSITSECANNASPALDAFFSELDKNNDGAIDVHEASKFIGGSIGGQEFDEPQEAADAAASFLHSLDGGDAGLTVSVDELDVHLHAVLSGVRVSEWIRYGVGLPQYAEAFRAHAVTPLDFPMLVQDNGKVLEEEFGMSSPFHRSKVVRAIRRLILGLGRPPSEPQAVTCTTTFPLTVGGGGGGRASVHWSPPADPGVPPLHRFLLERAGADGQWRQVAELDDPEPAAVMVALEPTAAAAAASFPAGVAALQQEGLPPGATGQQVLYRVAAWNLYGRSPYGLAACQLEPLPPPGYPLMAGPGPDAMNVTSGEEPGVRDLGAGPGEAVAVAAGDRQIADSRSGGGGGSKGGDGWGWGWGPAAPWNVGGVDGAGRGPGHQSAMCSGQGRVGLEDDGWERSEAGWKPPRAAPDCAADRLPVLLQNGEQHAVLECSGAADCGKCGGQESSAGGVSALVRAAWETASEPRAGPRPQTRSQAPQAQRKTQAQKPQPEAGKRWWSTLLMALLPGLLRVLPLRVLHAAVACVQRLLVAAHTAVGWRPPDWLLRLQPLPPPGLQPPLQPPPPGIPRWAPPLSRSLHEGLHPLAAGGERQMVSTPGAAGSGGVGGAAAAAAAAVPAMSATPAAGGASGLSRPSSWLEGFFAPVAAVSTALPAVSTASEPQAVPPRPGPPPYQQPAVATAAAAAVSPYGSPGGDSAGLQSGAGEGEGSRHGRAAPGVPSAVAAHSSCAGSALPYPHRSTSEGDICGMEDAERAPQGTSASSFHHPPGSPSHPSALHSHLRPYQFAGSAPSLGLGLGLLSSAGVSQGGAGGGNDGAGRREAEVELDLMAAAAAAGGGGGVSGRGRGKVCAVPGCGRKLDLRHYRDYMRRHYCGRCQRTVCGRHTAYSPHGPTGSCDHVSRCVCTSCFTHFNPAYQLFLLKHNKLQPAGEMRGLQAAGSSPAGSGSGSGSGLSSSQVQADARSARSGGAGGSAGGSRRGSATGAGVAASGAAEADNKSAAKLLWERAATKLKAVTRFRKKGHEGLGRDSQALEGIAECE